ncbi:MAG TPA: ATPase, T2SS/T4P/T4SS family, partial [Tepiditoga sp.]|nr:ATPase, T2SS/T4P/T4SS family [Tepiditoga sp.]
KQDIFKLIEEQRKISIKMDDDAKKFYGDEIKSEVKEENKNNFFTENKNSEIEELKKMIKNINNKVSGKNEVIFSIREKLLNNDFSHNIINEFLDESENLNITEDWESNEQLENKFSEILDKSLNLSGQQLKGKVILVGPTGVGKTTTIAKLTAIIKKQNRKIAIVTIDTYRIAASDQLKIYADIMGVPAYVCYTPDDLKITLETLVDYDTILIDTAGRSHKNDIQLDELKVFIDNIEPDFKILVMSATTRIKDMFDIYDNFSLINPQGLILTKLDETSSYGQIFSVSEYTGLPINFITDGQKVPDDISAPDKNVILARAVREVFK